MKGKVLSGKRWQMRKMRDPGLGSKETSGDGTCQGGLVSWVWKKEWGPTHREGPIPGHN